MKYMPPDFPDMLYDDKVAWMEMNKWIEELARHYKVQRVTSPVLSEFNLVLERNWFSIHNTYRIQFEHLSVNLLGVKYNKPTVKLLNRHGSPIDSSEHIYFWGYLRLKANYGKILIRPETLTDKIEELFEKVEIDFEEQKEFNWKYFVQAVNKAECKDILRQKSEFFKVMNKSSGIHLEFNGNSALFTNIKVASRHSLLVITSLGLLLDRVLNEKE